MMMIIITRYPASEDRLIVRPLLSRVCALRLQPAEPQPYSNSLSSAPPPAGPQTQHGLNSVIVPAKPRVTCEDSCEGSCEDSCEDSKTLGVLCNTLPPGFFFFFQQELTQDRRLSRQTCRPHGPISAPPIRSEPGVSPTAETVFPTVWTPVPAVSWPWFPACGSLEPSRRGGENAKKREKTGGKWARYGLKKGGPMTEQPQTQSTAGRA